MTNRQWIKDMQRIPKAMARRRVHSECGLLVGQSAE